MTDTQLPKLRMNIATALNSRYMRYAYVMLLSLFENQPENIDIRIYLLNTDLTDTDRTHLSELTAKYRQTIYFIHIDKSIFPASCPVSDSWSLEAYFRLAICDVLPNDIDRLLYLDVDIIINKSLIELYQTDFEGNVLCATPDPYQGSFPDIRNEIFAEHLRRGFTYFSSGMILFSLLAMRDKYHLTDYMKIAQKLDFHLEAPDQDLLNYVHWQEVKLLDANKHHLFARLAYQHDIHYEEIKQVTMVHFPGNKPWEGQFVHFDIEQLWWDYAMQTPFAFELMKEYIEAATNQPYIYNTMQQLSLEKQRLSEELGKSTALCQKLLQLIPSE